MHLFGRLSKFYSQVERYQGKNYNAKCLQFYFRKRPINPVELKTKDTGSQF